MGNSQKGWSPIKAMKQPLTALGPTHRQTPRQQACGVAAGQGARLALGQVVVEQQGGGSVQGWGQGVWQRG